MDSVPAILTLTLNPALDRATETPEIVPGLKLRCTQPRQDPGGGGINVSRMVQRLGGETVAFVALGGRTGDALAAALAAEGIEARPIAVAGETRTSLSVKDTGSGAQYRFMLPGPPLSGEEYRAAVTAVAAEAARDDFVVLSGSWPPGAPVGFAADLARALGAQGARLVVDTSGPALDNLVASPAGLDILRVDQAESEEAAGRPLPTRNDSVTFGQDLVARGIARALVMGRGAEGNVMVTPEGAWFAKAAGIDVVSTIGAGDSLLAALTYALSLGTPPDEALQWGAAAASAACTIPGTGICPPELVESLRPRCPVERLA